MCCLIGSSATLDLSLGRVSAEARGQRRGPIVLYTLYKGRRAARERERDPVTGCSSLRDEFQTLADRLARIPSVPCCHMYFCASRSIRNDLTGHVELLLGVTAGPTSLIGKPAYFARGPWLAKTSCIEYLGLAVVPVARGGRNSRDGAPCRSSQRLRL
eukprot:6181809-Pleurochrysis_carterae.AAC.3